jgi:GTP1/Obg family GTP-binding protein
MPYAVENALFQWDEGERRLREARDVERAQLRAAADTVFEELRRRLGGSFTLGELANFYGEGTDWAHDIAERRFAGTDTAWVVDAAFGRYARFASDFAGGKRYE